MKLKVIGHRGAVGLATENTLEAIKAASSLILYAVEIDLRLSSDGVFILHHDKSFKRIYGIDRNVADCTLSEIKLMQTQNGESIVTLSEALNLLKNKKVFIDLKCSNSAKKLMSVIKNFNDVDITIVSSLTSELAKIRSSYPTQQIFVYKQSYSLEVLRSAKILNANGIAINLWRLNPYLYFEAKKRELQIYTYVINSRLLTRILHFIYPKLIFCTNRPDKIN